MLRRLKITVYYIEIRPAIVLKGTLDHNLYILVRTVGLYHLFIPFLHRGTEHPFSPFTPPPLNGTLVTPDHHSPLLWRQSSMRKAPFKPFSCMLWCKEWPTSSLP